MSSSYDDKNMSTALTGAGYHTELINGEEIEKPLPKEIHAIIQAYLQITLASIVSRARFRVLPELNVLCGENHSDRIVPDVTVVLRDARYRDGDLLDAAALFVEILSPGQSLSNLFNTAERLLQRGTPVCWIIWPERRQAWIYRQDELHEATESLSFTLPEGERLEIKLRDMWAELD